MTGHDSVLLRADDPLIDMNYITSFTGMTDKWFYKLISEGHFLNPSNWGAAAAGTKVKWSSGCSIESRNHEGQQHETCCNAGTLAMQNTSVGIVEISPVPGAGADNFRSSSADYSPASQLFVIIS